MHTRYRFALTVLVLCPLLVAPVAASADEADRNSLKSEALALQFRINENFTVGSFKGTLISVKRHMSDKSAFRAGITFDLQSSDSEVMTFGSVVPRKESREMYLTRIDLQYLRYPSPASAVNLFLGTGPFFSYGRSEIHRIEPNDSKQISMSWSLGLGGVVGAEWFPFRSLGVHAEYGLSLAYGSVTNTTEVLGGTPFLTESTDSWTFSGESVLFGLSVYF